MKRRKGSEKILFLQKRKAVTRKEFFYRDGTWARKKEEDRSSLSCERKEGNGMNLSARSVGEVLQLAYEERVGKNGNGLTLSPASTGTKEEEWE